MNIKGIIKGTIVSFIVAVLFLVIGSILIYYNLLREQTVSVGLFIGTALGIFLGAFVAAKNAFSRIILNSLSVSLLFILLIVITSISVNGGFALHTRTTILIISTLASGVLGAIFGRN